MAGREAESAVSARARIAVYAGVWCLIGPGMAKLLHFAGWVADPWEAVALSVPLAAVYAFVCLSARFAVQAAPLRSATALRVLVMHLAAAALSSSFWVFIGRLWAQVLAARVFPGADEHLARAVPMLFASGVLLYLLAVAVHYVLLGYEESRAAERRAFASQLLSRDAELRALRVQLQPHFLFNSLNSISALTTIDPEGARRMCLLLSDFLRQSLKLGLAATIPLRQEIAVVEKYLAIEQVRFGSRLASRFDIGATAQDCLVPPLLLQPLVENAIVHGIGQSVEAGVLGIEARNTGTRLTIVVVNPYDPSVVGSRQGTGLGLDNVRRRLTAMYERDAWLEAGGADEVYRVVLSLPAVTKTQM